MNKDINEQDLAFRLKVVRQVKKMGQSELAKKVGITNVTLSKYEQGHTAPTADIIEKIAKVLGCDPGWLFAGKTEKDKYIQANETSASYVFIRQNPGEISAGHGIMPENAFEMKIAFRREWIQRKGDSRDMSLIRIKGDSMENTLFADDLVLVNHSIKSIAPEGGIYALAIDDHIMVKRLQLLWAAKKVQVISDNPKYKTLEVEENKININGRVIWVGHELEK